MEELLNYVISKPLVGAHQRFLWYALSKNRFLLSVPTHYTLRNDALLITILKDLEVWELETYRVDIIALNGHISEEVWNEAGLDRIMDFQV